MLATTIKSGIATNFDVGDPVENPNSKGAIFGAPDIQNQRSAFAFNNTQNHTGTVQKKVKYCKTKIHSFSQYHWYFVT